MSRYLVSIEGALEKSREFADLDEALEHAERETGADRTFVVGKVREAGAPVILVSRGPDSTERSQDRARRARRKDAMYS